MSQFKIDLKHSSSYLVTIDSEPENMMLIIYLINNSSKKPYTSFESVTKKALKYTHINMKLSRLILVVVLGISVVVAESEGK